MDRKTLLQAIAEGMRNTPEEAFLSVLIIVSVILLFILVSIIYQYVFRKRKLNDWAKEYNGLIRKYDLTINELDLIDKLVLFLIEPQRKLLLIKNKNTFLQALSLLEKRERQIFPLGKVLATKLFGQEGALVPKGLHIPYGSGRPVRLFSTDGFIYSGIQISRKKDIITVDHIKKRNNENKKQQGRLFIQDYKGIITFQVERVRKLSENSLQVQIIDKGSREKVKLSLSGICVYYPGEEEPLLSRLYFFPNGTYMIEIPNGALKQGQAVKLALREETEKIYRVNALVSGLSLNKRYARLTFGYIKS
ncbi:MAG: hypothetical protein JEY91_05170 [Spirochaetaceae bacterium]|nr:hypothetical protein [Spirochaetaceae bacterium]